MPNRVLFNFSEQFHFGESIFYGILLFADYSHGLQKLHDLGQGRHPETDNGLTGLPYLTGGLILCDRFISAGRMTVKRNYKICRIELHEQKWVVEIIY